MTSQVTSPIAHSRRPWRSAGVLFAGLLTVVVLSTATDAVMHATGVFPPMGEPMSDALFLLATAYRVVFGILGSYIAARLAPDRPMGHALVLGAVGLVLSTLGAVATWNSGPAFGPRWYPLALVVTALPNAWLGGVLHRMQSGR